MHPISPVLPWYLPPGYSDVVYAKDQPEHRDLPAVKDVHGRVITRWRLSWLERFRIWWHGDCYLTVQTFGQPLQPVKLEVLPPYVEVAIPEPYRENFYQVRKAVPLLRRSEVPGAVKQVRAIIVGTQVSWHEDRDLT